MWTKKPYNNAFPPNGCRQPDNTCETDEERNEEDRIFLELCNVIPGPFNDPRYFDDNGDQW